MSPLTKRIQAIEFSCHQELLTQGETLKLILFLKNIFILQ